MDGGNNEKIVGYFIEEAREHLETIEKGILELELAVEDKERINELFRAAHSIKGGQPCSTLRPFRRQHTVWRMPLKS